MTDASGATPILVEKDYNEPMPLNPIVPIITPSANDDGAMLARNSAT
jgi:hypothetical protein